MEADSTPARLRPAIATLESQSSHLKTTPGEVDPFLRESARWSAAKGDTYYTNDAVGNLLTISWAPSTLINFLYDPLNRVTNMVDAVGTTKYTYTAGNQLFRRRPLCQRYRD